jgi:hypothetical protein
LKELVARRACRVAARDAWTALLDIPRWLVALDSVDRADVGDDAVTQVGGRFTVLLHEGLELQCRIAELRPERRMTVTVRWRRLLRADFVYEIAPHQQGCELVHGRSYRGLVTQALGTVWRGREEEEQAAVLREWCWEAGSIAAVRRYAS